MDFHTTPEPAKNLNDDSARSQLAYLLFVVATILLCCAPALVVWFWRWAL